MHVLRQLRAHCYLLSYRVSQGVLHRDAKRVGSPVRGYWVSRMTNPHSLTTSARFSATLTWQGQTLTVPVLIDSRADESFVDLQYERRFSLLPLWRSLSQPLPWTATPWVPSPTGPSPLLSRYQGTKWRTSAPTSFTPPTPRSFWAAPGWSFTPPTSAGARGAYSAGAPPATPAESGPPRHPPGSNAPVLPPPRPLHHSCGVSRPRRGLQ